MTNTEAFKLQNNISFKEMTTLMKKLKRHISLFQMNFEA